MAALAAGVALGAAVGSMVFAGVSGVANSATAWQGYKKVDHYEGSEGAETGNSQSFGCFGCPFVKKDYVKHYFVCNLKRDDTSPLPPSCMILFPAPVDDSAPTRRHRFMKLIYRKFHRLRRGKPPRVAKTPPNTPSLGGTVKVTELQNTNHHLGDKKVGLTTAHLQNGKHSRSLPPSDTYVGLNMGRQAAYTSTMAKEHWNTFQNGSFTADEKTAPPTIAVVNWTAQVITMYIKPNNKAKEMYYRNYQVLNPNLALFEKEFKGFVVLSGIIVDGKLAGTNSQIVVAKDNRRCPLKSVNSWTWLGFERDPNMKLPSKFQFLAMKRAAIFGIIESLYKDPTLLDVTMLDGGKGCQKECAQVVALHKERLEFQPDNAFSVFAFNANEYSNQRVLVG
ncbi:hypothetical protein KC19_4G032700 [Ceratodon purpureus]|uniref:Uncharacterized protein n=1 Tax=Ceratodon purpureus TaxID=3225 RepID=A0A8T0I644_CERPU|nr:hypothetical protein KC19_4G032700 [Ceratodon purpureus]